MKEFNKDKLLGTNMPRGGYAISGTDWAITKGKDAPMIINLNTPGTFGDEWIDTYGSSLDSFLSIIDGFKVVESINTITVAGIYKDSFPNSATENLWQKVTHSDFPETPIQQVQYMVSGGDIETGRARVDNFGEVFNTRALCMRSPMMLFGYGRTIDMLPLNKDSDNERLNSENSKLDRSLWKGGTLDARWDERRNVWGTWNDMIVDHESKGLGTTVFSTNSDSDEGFPYLKGKLQDVWWVRQPDSLSGTNGKVDGAQTAEIMTHLKHKFFDEDTDGSARLDTVFVIPHKDASEEDDACHPKGDEKVLGDETTGDGEAIDIRTTVHFWKENEVDGPIKFGNKKSDLDNVACSNDDSCLFTGEMIFLDESVIACSAGGTDGSSISIATPGDAPCEWVPAIRIDECTLVGEKFGVLVENDRSLAIRINSVCNSVASYTEALVKTIDSSDNSLAGVIGCLNDAIQGLAGAVTGGFASIAVWVMSISQALFAALVDAIDGLVADINAALAACECESTVTFALSGDAPGGGFAIPAVRAPKCAALTAAPDAFDCEECVGTDIAAPCATNEESGPFRTGTPCGSSSSGPRPDYDGAGECEG